MKSVAGVLTPVELTGPVNGVSLVPTGRLPARGDCRLMLALHRAAPLLRSLGIDQLHYSNIYRRSRMPSGRLSRHAMGLAIDVHGLRVAGQLLRVKGDYTPGLGDGCATDSPPLNRVSCLLKRDGYFDRVLTPDTNRAHHNHFHFAILSLHRRRFVPRTTPAAPDTD